ncbi:MAG TPA: ABC transporter permease [Bryobacteraceae bacterium]|jgi:ABC-type Na+ efflux pump permease subunit
MRTLRAILGVAAKEFQHMRHDPLTQGLVIAVPLLQLTIFGFALSLHATHTPAAVLNRDHHSASRMLITALTHSAAFDVREVTADPEELQALFRRGAVSAAIEIPEDYSANELYRRPSTLRVWADATDGVTVSQTILAAWGLSLRESAERLLAAQGGSSGPIPVGLETRLAGRAERAADVFVPALTGILIHMITLLFTTLAIVGEKERGTWDQMLATPLGASGALAGKLLAGAAVGLAEALFLLSLMRFGFGIPIRGSVMLLSVVVVAIIATSLALAVLSATFAKSQARGMQFTYLLFLPSILLSGFVFPRGAMPAPIYAFSSALPATFFVRLLRGVIMRGAGFSDVLPDLGGLALISAVLVCAAWLTRERGTTT